MKKVQEFIIEADTTFVQMYFMSGNNPRTIGIHPLHLEKAIKEYADKNFQEGSTVESTNN